MCIVQFPQWLVITSLHCRQVSWSQFLRDQSIYILAARRNAANLYKIKPTEEEQDVIASETNYVKPVQE